MSFSGGVLFTNSGLILKAKAEAGKNLVFTKLAIGDGQLSGQSQLELTNLINKKLDVSISAIKQSGTLCNVRGVFSNQSITTGFYFRELGLYARDPDTNVETLYCYGNAGTLAEYISAGSGAEVLEKNLSINSIIGNATSVSAVINSSMIYATKQDLDDLKIEIIPMLYITDVTTNSKYKWGMDNGMPYLEEVSS